MDNENRRTEQDGEAAESADTVKEKEEKEEKEVKEIKEIKKYTEQDFLCDLEWTGKAYIVCIVLSALLAVASVAVAVHLKVIFGLIGAIASVLVYMGLVGHILYSRLGFSYTSTTGALKITEIYGKGRDEIWIPRKLLLLDVREIGDEACDHASSSELRFIHLPSTLRSIGKDAFLKCEKLECICYEGSPEEWDAIEKGAELDGVKVIFFDKVQYPEKPAKKSGPDAEPRNAASDGAGEREEIEK